jgi:hypothetical protein
MMNTKYRKWELLGIFLVICLDKREKSEILAGGVRRGIAPMPKSVRLPRFLNSDNRVFVIKITYLSCSIHLPFILHLGVVSESFFPLFEIFRDLGAKSVIFRCFLILGYLLSENTPYPGCGFETLMTLGISPRVC